MKKKFLALLLALVMVVGMLPMAAFAAEGDTTDPIKEALGVAANQGVYTLTEDRTLTATLNVTKNVTIDLNGHVLTGPASGRAIFVADQGNLTIKDSQGKEANVSTANGKTTATYAGTGKITSASQTIYVSAGGSLTVESGWVESSKNQAITIEGTTDKTASATINGGYITSQETGISVFSKAVLNFAGGVVQTVDNNALAGNGLAKYAGSEINITGGTLIANIKSPDYIPSGVYFPNEGNLTIDGGEIYANGGAGVVVRGGKTGFTFKGGKVTATGTAIGKVGDSGNSVKCSAVYLDGKATGYANNAQIQIQGGNFASDSSVPVVYWDKASNETNGNAEAVSQLFAITGGTFSSDPFAAGTNTTNIEKPEKYKYDESSKTVVPDVAEATVSFAIDNSDIAYFNETNGKKAADLFTSGKVETNGAKVLVSGTAKYIQDWTAFSSDKTEASGNYLPLKVTVTATGATKAATDLVEKVVVKGHKELTFNASDFFGDGVLIMQLNKLVGNNGLSDSHFQITIYWKDNVQTEGTKATGDTASTSYTTYDIDCSKIMLELPAIPSAENGTLNLDQNKDQVAADITNIINATHMDNQTTDSSDSTGETPDVDNTKNTVDIPFDATTSKDTGDAAGTVTLPTTVVAALQGGKKEGTQVEVTATVKTDAANVTLSEGAIQKLDSTSNATTIKVEPKDADALKTLGSSSGSGTTTDASKLADKVYAAVDVTVKANNQDVFQANNADSGAPITISIKVNKGGNYHVLYFKSNGDVEKMVAGTVEAVGNETDGWYVPFTTKHLSIYGVMESTKENDELIKDLTMNSGADDSEQAAGALKITMGTTAVNGLYEAKVEGLDTSNTYTVQISRGTNAAPAVIFTIRPTATSMTFSVNAGSVINIWSGAVTINNGVPSAGTSPVTATAGA